MPVCWNLARSAGKSCHSSSASFPFGGSGRKSPKWKMNRASTNPFACISTRLHGISLTPFDSFRNQIQGSGRNADIGALPVDTITVEGITYKDYEQLLPIECKRLPTPPDSRRSELEYVHGMPGKRTGGIERFKHGLHGRENRHALLIAYVQAKSFVYWQTLINARLVEMANNGSSAGLWRPVETLSEPASGQNAEVARLSSRHKRLRPPCCSNSVDMEHLWLRMN